MTRAGLKLLAYVIAGLLLLAGFNHLAGFVPFSPQWSARRAEAKADRLTDQVSSLERQAEGQAEIERAKDTYHTREVIIREGTAQAIAEVRSLPDAETPLSQDRADRLHAIDRSLCDRSGPICPAADAP
jgi:hypothetical protein